MDQFIRVYIAMCSMLTSSGCLSAHVPRPANACMQRADIIKLSDQDLEALLAIDLTPSLLNPCMVRWVHARA